jgi:hypothetical protein
MYVSFFIIKDTFLMKNLKAQFYMNQQELVSMAVDVKSFWVYVNESLFSLQCYMTDTP